MTALFNLALFQRRAGRFDEAIATFRTVLGMSPDADGARMMLGSALLLEGYAANALVEIDKEKSEFCRLSGLAMVYHALGRKADSDAALEALIHEYEKDSASNIAQVYAFRGEADKTFEWRGKAIESADPGLSEIVPENLLAKVHSDPRWFPSLRRIDSAPEQLAKIEFKVTPPD